MVYDLRGEILEQTDVDIGTTPRTVIDMARNMVERRLPTGQTTVTMRTNSQPRHRSIRVCFVA